MARAGHILVEEAEHVAAEVGSEKRPRLPECFRFAVEEAEHVAAEVGSEKRISSVATRRTTTTLGKAKASGRRRTNSGSTTRKSPTTRHGHLAMRNMERAQTIMNSIFETKPRSRPSWENRSACLRQIINVSLLDDSAAICRITLRPCSCNTPSRGIRTFSPTQMLRVMLLGTRGPTATRGVRSQPTQCARGHVIGTLKSARALMRTRPFETLQRG